MATHRHLPEVASTNSWAAAYLATDETVKLPLLVTCDQQTAGRGRGSRRWTHQPGGLAFSVVVPCPWQGPDGERSTAQRILPIWTALCLRRTAAHFLPQQRCQLKWPNDLMIADRKNAGILIETASTSLQPAIVGIGLNINNSLNDDATLLPGTGFSWSEVGEVHSLPNVLLQFLGQWWPLPPASATTLTELRQEFATVDWLRGQSITVQAAAAWQRTVDGQLMVLADDSEGRSPGEYSGSYQGLSPEGYLQLTDSNGRWLVFPSADQVRPLS